MGSYFKPLRRKIGVMTLMMACVFEVGWIRSLNTNDQVSFKNLDLWTGDGSILVRWTTGSAHANEPFRHAAKESRFSPYNGRGAKSYYDWRRWGFAYGKRDDAQPLENGGVIPFTRFNYCLPFSSIVIPLTLLSAWLLLSKPRARRTPVNPVPEKAA